MDRPHGQLADGDARVRPVGHRLAASVADGRLGAFPGGVSGVARTAGGRRFHRTTPCSPLGAVLPAFWAGVGGFHLRSLQGPYGAAWASMASDHDGTLYPRVTGLRSGSRFSRTKGFEDGRRDAREVRRPGADRGHPVELSSSEESRGGFLGVEGFHVCRPAQTWSDLVEVAESTTPALSDGQFQGLPFKINSRSPHRPLPVGLLRNPPERSERSVWRGRPLVGEG